jgi:probable HAF family extracellular repeat protein
MKYLRLSATLAVAAFALAACSNGSSTLGTVPNSPSTPSITPAGTANPIGPKSLGGQTGQNAGVNVQYSVIELPSLGGTYSEANAIDEDGSVVGDSNLPGDATYHAVVWRGTTITDLGTLGGPNSFANILNDEGFVGGAAGSATTDPLGENFCDSHVICSAVVWHDGRTIQLPTLGGPRTGRH